MNTNFLPNIKSYEELLDILELFYRINKHSLLLRSHHPETNDVVHKNMRMGMSMAGYLQATEEQRSWLPSAYLHLRDFDKQYSKKHHMPESIKLTTMKPDGTAALLLGVTPGAHPGYSEFMFRRITIASDHQLVDICRKHGYPIEYKRELDGTEDYGSVIVTFPYSYPKGTRLAKDMTAIDQLKVIRRLQTEWSDNSVSCTIYYKKEEIPEIRRYLERYYKGNYKTLSFLLHSEHGFQQAPYEEVTEEQYNDLISKCTKITSTDAVGVIFEGADECASGACPVK